MKNQAKHLRIIKPEKFYSGFISDPLTSYYKLTSNSRNYRNTNLALELWVSWAEKRKEFLELDSPIIKPVVDRIDQLKILVHIEIALKQEQQELRLKLSQKKLNKRRFLIQALCLHKLGYPENEEPRQYNCSDLLRILKSLDKDLLFSNETDLGFEKDEIEFVKKLIHNYMELMYIEKMYDHFVIGEYEVSLSATIPEKDISIYGLDLTDEELRKENLLLLSRTKQLLKEKFLQDKAEQSLKVAAEHRNTIRRHEKMLDDAMKNMELEKSFSLHYYIELEKEGLTSYVNAMTNIYFPQEEIDVNRVSINFKDHEILLVRIIYALGALSGHSMGLHIADHGNEAQVLQRDSFLQIFTHSEEWRALNLKKPEQEHILDLILSVNNELPYSPIVQTGEDEFFLVPWALFENNGYERVFYNYLITEMLFADPNGNKNEEENKEEHQVRADALANTIAAKVKSVWPDVKVASNFKWPKKDEIWGRRGEVDVVIYFPDENLLLLSEIKLCNTLSKSTYKQLRWLNQSIYKGEKSAAFQLQKDINFFRNEKAYPHIAEQLGLDPTAKFNPNIFPLIMSDVFWVDHTKVQYNSLTGEEADCISTFEFIKLLDGLADFVNGKKTELPLKQRGAWLKKTIFENKFWSGLVVDKKSLREYCVISHCEKTKTKIGLKV